MRRLLASLFTLCVLLTPGVDPRRIAYAQELPTLTITVLDPTGARLVGATVTVRGSDGNAVTVQADGSGIARVPVVGGSRVDVDVTADGFDEGHVSQVQVRRDTRRTVRLALAKVFETVDVGRDPRERASDPRTDAFATVLGAAEIRELPDDPDEMERVLREMAGPGAVMRVNGFRGGRLPPKDQIAQIRFHRNMFAADTHEPGFLSVDVITKPGFDAWRGSAGIGARDSALAAKNALAPVKGDERHVRGSVTASGPLLKKRSSLSVSADGVDAYDSQTLVGATLDGAFARTVRRPRTTTNLTARLEHALSPAQQLRAEVQHGQAQTRNLGVGTFDLESRGYTQSTDTFVVRGSIAGGFRKSMFNEFRASWQQSSVDSTSDVSTPTVSVLNAFTSGGAQVDGARRSSVLEVSNDLDYARGRHAVRAGVLLTTGRYRTDERRNTLGTFTFVDLAAFAAGRAATFTQNIGNPVATVAQTQVASYVQDDLRVSPRLTVSAGVRQEFQGDIGGLHLGPRGGLAWSPFRSGRTTVRAGAGLFFDWFEADNALRAVQLDGAHQQVLTSLAPSYPATSSAPPLTLRNGRVTLASDLTQPRIVDSSAGIEQTFGAVRLNTTVIHRRGSRELRGIDVNAPSSGVRPEPAAGPVTRVSSVARSGSDGVSVNLNIVKPERRLFIAANYTLSRSWNETDSPFSLAANAAALSSERGPAADDARHRAMGFASVPIGRGVTAGISFLVRSALPYNVTTGRDDNGDSLLTDRPVGTARNSARGAATADVGMRLAWRTGFGGPAAPPSGPQVRIVRGGSDSNPLADMPGGASDRRYGVELYAQLFNALNRSNPTQFGGVMTSPFFGQPVAAGAPRRLEVGARLTL